MFLIITQLKPLIRILWYFRAQARWVVIDMVFGYYWWTVI